MKDGQAELEAQIRKLEKEVRDAVAKINNIHAVDRDSTTKEQVQGIHDNFAKDLQNQKEDLLAQIDQLHGEITQKEAEHWERLQHSQKEELEKTKANLREIEQKLEGTAMK